ncbi:MAG: hypothetical protein ACSLE1_22905 [Sphingobium sp.]
MDDYEREAIAAFLAPTPAEAIRQAAAQGKLLMPPGFVGSLAQFIY